MNKLIDTNVNEGRRVFLQNTACLVAAAAVFSANSVIAAPATAKPFVLAKLPYDTGALAPYISKETAELHYGKHHGGYVAKLNELAVGTAYAGKSLQNVIKSAKQNNDIEIFNNAAQIYNHDFYWRSMRPPMISQGGDALPLPLQQRVAAAFGNEAGFTDAFLQKTVNHFGSGWVWLVQKQNGELDLIATSNADIPSHRPLLVMDIWEHAYYVDYRNARAEYAKIFLQYLVNWEFASTQLN